MEVFDRRNPTVREVAVAVDAIFREGLDIPQTSSWLSFVKDGLLSFEDEDDLVCKYQSCFAQLVVRPGLVSLAHSLLTILCRSHGKNCLSLSVSSLCAV